MAHKKRKNSKGPPVTVQQTSTVTTITSGPIPSPSTLKEYDEIIPGAAERILSMAEQEAAHLRNIEREALIKASEQVKRGQVFGLIIGILAFLTSIIALVLGSEKTAIALGGTTVVGLVAVFVTGRFSQADKLPPPQP